MPDRAQRRLVKNSFIVEFADGHRKLRHLFLFNDVIACAKYKVFILYYVINSLKMNILQRELNNARFKTKIFKLIGFCKTSTTVKIYRQIKKVEVL
jgi:hypothetical protein